MQNTEKIENEIVSKEIEIASLQQQHGQVINAMKQELSASKAVIEQLRLENTSISVTNASLNEKLKKYQNQTQSLKSTILENQQKQIEAMETQQAKNVELQREITMLKQLLKQKETKQNKINLSHTPNLRKRKHTEIEDNEDND